MTSHPKDLSDKLIEAYGKCEKLCHYIHLPVQSGSSKVLKEMNRRYTREAYLEIVRKLREIDPQIAISTDIIVGFPGETEEEFETTVEFIKKIRFYETHVFKYSRRKGTRADRMPDQIPEQIKTKRSEKLLELHRENSKNYRNRLIGTTVEVLMEEAQEIDGICWQVGHTREYVKVAVPQDESLTNQTVQVFVDGFRDQEMMQGKLRLNL